METVQPTKSQIRVRSLKEVERHEQIAGHWCTRRNLRCRVRSSILVRITESSCVYEAKRIGIIQEFVEDRLCVEDSSVCIGVTRGEILSKVDESGVVVFQSTFDQCNRSRTLANHKWCSICWRYCQEQERSSAILVEVF